MSGKEVPENELLFDARDVKNMNGGKHVNLSNLIQKAMSKKQRKKNPATIYKVACFWIRHVPGFILTLFH